MSEPAQFMDSKQPSEGFHYRFNFTNDLGSDGISSAVVAAEDLSDGSDVTDTLIDSDKQVISGQYVYVYVQAGSDGKDYKITVTITADDDSSSIYELEGIVPVREV